MTNKFLTSVACFAILVGAGQSLAQSPSGTAGQGKAAIQDSPSSEAPDTGTMQKQPGKKMQQPGRQGAQAQQPSQGAQAQQPSPQGTKMQPSAQQGAQAQPEPQQGTKIQQGRQPLQPGAQPQQTGQMQGTGQGMRTPQRAGSATGQETAEGGNLTVEQRSKIVGVIKQENVQPLRNVNFSVSVGRRVPREVELHALP